MITNTTHDERVAAIKAAALSFDCPLCGAASGSSCRTRAVAGRPGGRAKDWPHSQRRALTTPPSERRQPPNRVDALCCVCGLKRTVNPDYHRSSDPNYRYGEEARKQGWRATQTLKCQECGDGTRHAVLLEPREPYCDYTERWQRYTLGGAWEGDARYAPDLDRLREEYFAQFPRNPNLHHRFYIEDATERWDAGEKTATALCGAAGTSSTDPRTWGTTSVKQARQQEKYDGYVVAEQLGDIEYTDVGAVPTVTRWP